MSQNRDVGHPIFFGESRSRRFEFVLSHLSEASIHPTDKDLFVGSPETGHPFPGGGCRTGKEEAGPSAPLNNASLGMTQRGWMAAAGPMAGGND